MPPPSHTRALNPPAPSLTRRAPCAAPSCTSASYFLPPRSRPADVTAEQEVEAAVFHQAWIPRRLEEVTTYERDHERLKKAGAARCGVVRGGLVGSSCVLRVPAGSGGRNARPGRSARCDARSGGGGLLRGQSMLRAFGCLHFCVQVLLHLLCLAHQ